MSFPNRETENQLTVISSQMDRMWQQMPVPRLLLQCLNKQQVLCVIKQVDYKLKIAQFLNWVVWDFLRFSCYELLMYLDINPLLGFPGGSDGKESACNAGDLGSVPRLGRCLRGGGGNGNPPQCSCLENPMDQADWQATFHGVARIRHDLANTDFFFLPLSVISFTNIFSHSIGCLLLIEI